MSETIKVYRSDIQSTKTFQSLPNYRKKIIEKKSVIEKIENHVNIATIKGFDNWSIQEKLNNAIIGIVKEILLKNHKK